MTLGGCIFGFSGSDGFSDCWFVSDEVSGLDVELAPEGTAVAAGSFAEATCPGAFDVGLVLDFLVTTSSGVEAGRLSGMLYGPSCATASCVGSDSGIGNPFVISRSSRRACKYGP